MVDHVSVHVGSDVFAGILHQCDQPLDTHGKTASRLRLPAQLLDEAIVTAAPADGALGTKLVRHPLKHRKVVIVQTAHQPRIDQKRQR